MGMNRLEDPGYRFYLASGNDRGDVSVKVDGAVLVLSVWVYFTHSLQHPQALVPNNEFHTVQPVAAEPLEEAHPARFVLFHPLGGAQDFTVTVFDDCDRDQNGYVLTFLFNSLFVDSETFVPQRASVISSSTRRTETPATYISMRDSSTLLSRGGTTL